MTPTEMTDLLARAAAIDPRVQPTPERALAWFPYFADYPQEQVLEALHEHYASSDRAVMPFNLLYLVKGKRERLIMVNRASIDQFATDDADRRHLERRFADGLTHLDLQRERGARGIGHHSRQAALALESIGRSIE